MTRSQNIYYAVEYALVRLLLGLLRAFPVRIRLSLGARALGRILQSSRNARRRVYQNLRYIYPELSSHEHDEIFREVCQTFSHTLIEILNNDAYGPLTDRFHATGPGLEVINARPPNAGFVLVSGHFGQWDAARHYLKSQGREVGAVYRPSNNPYFDRLFLKQIGHAGNPIFAKGRRGTMEMVRHAKSGGAVAILLDQKFGGGEKLDFLGKPATTSLAAAEIALKFDLPLIPVYGVRRPDSPDIDIIFEAPIPPTNAREMTQACNDSLSNMVSRHPGQWYWFHRRWHTKKGMPVT